MDVYASQANYHRIRKARLHTARAPWDASVSINAVFPTPRGHVLAIVAARFVFDRGSGGATNAVSIQIGTYLRTTGAAVDADGLVTAVDWPGAAATTAIGITQVLTLATTLNHASTDTLPRVLATECIIANGDGVEAGNASVGAIEIDYYIMDDVDVETPES